MGNLTIKQFIRKYEGKDIPILLGFVEDGKIILENLAGEELPLELLNFVQENNLTFKKFQILKQIATYKASNLPVPAELEEMLEDEDES